MRWAKPSFQLLDPQAPEVDKFQHLGPSGASHATHPKRSKRSQAGPKKTTAAWHGGDADVGGGRGVVKTCDKVFPNGLPKS